MNDIYVALELGTTRTVLALGERTAGDRIKITHAEIPSSGIRKSQILNITDALQSTRAVLREIEKKQDAQGLKVTIGNALLVVSGQHILTSHADGQALVEGCQVGENEISEVARRAREFPLPKGRELLDIADQDYELDNLSGITSPKGMSGKMLKLNTLQIHADANRIQDAKSAVEDAHIEISESVFAATCAADAVLEDYERKNGVLVLDLGGGSTGYAVYTDGFLATAGVIGVGGDHATNDIAHAFQTTNAQAEELKTEHAAAVLGRYAPEDARVHIVGSTALMENRTISRRALDIVVNARYKELFGILRTTLEEQNLLHRLHAGVVLTGGGANLRDIDALAQQEFGTSVRKGRPLGVEGLDDDPSPWSYAAISGALLYAQRSDEDKPLLGGLFGRFFK